MVAGWDPLEALRLVWDAFAVIFWEDGAVNTFYVYILVFTLLLGIIAAIIMMSGGTAAFSDRAVRRIRTRRGAKALPAILGIVIFIDDYFNALAVGQVSPAGHRQAPRLPHQARLHRRLHVGPGRRARPLGAKRALVIPFALLVAGVLAGITWTG